ncbi:hypothetical protein LTR84_011483 [Exophiala bonariae]|uniref:amidase n=1 Tax=Exophiala bonariae TaxID=1690606 RepID=A0AAV9NIP4_9EURO|nr:hypothetical protein LTR84_011483 [Exophiala bonariae]
MVTQSWEAKAEKARERLARSIAKEWLLDKSSCPSHGRLNVMDVPEESGRLSVEEILITNSDASGLVSKMEIGEWTAEQVTVAYLKRATIGHQLLNMATEFMVEDALAQARALDEYYRQHKKLVGPLHGVPISTKEHISHKGRLVHASYVALVDNVAAEDAFLVRLLKASGAVFHLRTNEPQTMMTGDTENNLTGRTKNGHNLRLANGGSSGGEGASVSFKCAAIGLGTDIGGSIRIPAAFNGCYGFRPTACRLPYGGVFLPGEGQESIRCVIGPLTRGIDDIELLMSSVLVQKPWEEELSLVPLPWKSAATSKNITIGVMWSDGIVNPQPPMQRALRMTVEKLKAAGVTVVDFEPYKTAEAMDIITSKQGSIFDSSLDNLLTYIALFFPDGGKTQWDLLKQSGEPVYQQSRAMLEIAREITVAENWAYNARRDALRNEFHSLMTQRGVNVILTAPYPGAAPLVGTVDYGVYTMLWNMLDMPALVMPVGLTVDPTLDRKSPSYQTISEYDKGQFDKFDAEDSVGAPVCVQVVGKHFRDEETIAAARIIEVALARTAVVPAL